MDPGTNSQRSWITIKPNLIAKPEWGIPLQGYDTGILISMAVKMLLMMALIPFLVKGQDLQISAQTLSKATTKDLFGSLRKGLGVAQVVICNNTSEDLIGKSAVPLARVSSQIRTSGGYTILDQTAAVVVVNAAQGKSKLATVMRYVGAGDGTVASLVALRTINPNSTWGALIVASATIAGVVSMSLGQAVPTHTGMTLATAMLPDPLQLEASGSNGSCVKGYAIIEVDPTSKNLELNIPLIESRNK